MILDTHAWVFYATGRPIEKRVLRRIEKARSEGRLHIAASRRATRDARIIDHAKALGLDIVGI